MRNSSRSRSLVVLTLVTVGLAILGVAALGLGPKHRDSSMTVAAIGAEEWPPPSDPPRDEPVHRPPTTSTTAAPTTTTTAPRPPVTVKPKPKTTTTRPAPKPGDVARGLAPNAFLACVARWESGGGGTPQYHAGPAGAYGILVSTWTNRTLGYSTRYGTSTAGAASDADQDAAALDLFQRYGTKPWTTRSKCGR